MNGKILFIAGAIILVVITALLTTFWYYADSSQEKHDDVLVNEATGMTASFSNFTSVEFEQSTFDSTQVPKIQEEVCGQVVRSDWVPEKVKFAHLEPAATIYRIPCSINPAGFYYHYFYESGTPGVMVMIEYDNPNRQDHSLFTISSHPQAAEYVMLFSIVRGEELGIFHFAINDLEYEQMMERCAKNNGNAADVHSSTTKGLTVSNAEGQSYTVRVNVLEDIDGTVVYYEYAVAPTGLVELLDTRDIAECGYAI